MKEEENETDFKERTNENGQLEIDIDIFEESYKKIYNGKYVFDRVKWKHRKIIFEAQRAMGQTDSIESVLVDIAKERKVQVKHVRQMMVDDKLTPEEEERINTITGQSMDMEKMFGIAPTMFGNLLIKSPVPMKNDEDLEEVDIGVVILLFNRVTEWAMDAMTISNKRKKK